jgi:hypothetical protein
MKPGLFLNINCQVLTLPFYSFRFQVFEIGLPVFFLSILLIVKNNVGNQERTLVEPTFPDNSDAFTPLAFADYVTALQAQRVCEGPSALSGMPGNQTDWQIPFVLCDVRGCTEDNVGESGLEYCEYQIMGVAPSTETDAGGKARSEQFRDYIHRMYPAVDPAGSADLPFDHDFVKVFASSKDIENYVKSAEYGKAGNPKLTFAIVWEGNDANSYKYSLRQNSTIFNVPREDARPASLTTPPTTELLDSFAVDDRSCPEFDGAPLLGVKGQSCTGKYLYNALIPMHQLVNDFILDDSGAAATGAYVARNGVRFAPFPTRQYYEGGIFDSFSGTLMNRRGGLLTVIPSQFPSLLRSSIACTLSLKSFCRVVGHFGLAVSHRCHDFVCLFRKRITPERADENDERYRVRHWLVLVYDVHLTSHSYYFLYRRSFHRVVRKFGRCLPLRLLGVWFYRCGYVLHAPGQFHDQGHSWYPYRYFDLLDGGHSSHHYQFRRW